MRAAKRDADIVATAQMHHLGKPLAFILAVSVEENDEGIGVAFFELLRNEDGDWTIVVDAEAAIVNAFFPVRQRAECHGSRRVSTPEGRFDLGVERAIALDPSASMRRRIVSPRESVNDKISAMSSESRKVGRER